MKLFTIGHSNHDLDKFVGLLKDQGIETLVDVRTAPYSRHNIKFDKDILESALPKYHIRYVFSGKRLGGRPPDPTLYKGKKLPEEGTDYLHEVDYPEVMNRSWFSQGIDQLIEVAGHQVTGIMCSEEDPAKCHRHHLIAKYIMEDFPEVEVWHIRGDGKVYQAKSIHASLDKPAKEQLSLFGSDQE